MATTIEKLTFYTARYIPDKLKLITNAYMSHIGEHKHYPNSICGIINTNAFYEQIFAVFSSRILNWSSTSNLNKILKDMSFIIVSSPNDLNDKVIKKQLGNNICHINTFNIHFMSIYSNTRIYIVND